MNKQRIILLALLSLCFTCFAYSQTRAEYWIDSDPGQGKATSFSISSDAAEVDIPTGSLTYGWHIAGFRVHQSRWSQTYTHRFFIAPPAPAAAELTAAEYWVDTDPGQGKALPLAVAAGQSEISLDVLQTDTLTEGYHIFGLRVRYGNEWSQTYTHRFLHTVKQVVDTHIEAVEAYWDDNTEQVISIPFVQVGDSAIIDGYDFDTENLTYGKHYLYLYVKANGVKSIITRYEICKSAVPQLFFAAIYYTGDEAFTLSDMVSPTGGTFYINDIEATFFNPQANEAGTYHVRYVVTDTDGCTAEAETTFELRVRGEETALDETPTPSSTSKILRNETIYILRVDKMYTITGQEVR